ncbi:MAG: hypothetical protein IJA14_02175 [Alphaproteobacteria bacterium]|nr:hypothetical protein [Alphaproteobacteria bacterium]
MKSIVQFLCIASTLNINVSVFAMPPHLHSGGQNVLSHRQVINVSQQSEPNVKIVNKLPLLNSQKTKNGSKLADISRKSQHSQKTLPCKSNIFRLTMVPRNKLSSKLSTKNKAIQNIRKKLIDESKKNKGNCEENDIEPSERSRILVPINFESSSSSGVTSAELSRSPTPTIKYHEHDENYLEGFDYVNPNPDESQTFLSNNSSQSVIPVPKSDLRVPVLSQEADIYLIGNEHNENYLEGFDYTSPNRLEYNDLDNFFYQNEGEYPMCNDNLFGN